MRADSFAQSEVRQALSEIDTWGFESAQTLETSTAEGDDGAKARLVLLEGNTVDVRCSEAGWTLSQSESLTCSLEPELYDRKFDTLDDLLLAVSPRFEEKRMEKLFEKLSQLAEARPRFGDDDEQEAEQDRDHFEQRTDDR
ncbi:hypothetical protein JCM3766R1_002845 [Sporobolomyces carnicolor]